MFAVISWEWCSFSSFLCRLCWTAKDVQVLSWQKVEKCQEIQRSHTELHQPGTCPTIFILGRSGAINISTCLERTLFYVLITCFKWTFLEISSCSKLKNWLVASLCQHTHQPGRVHNSLQKVRILHQRHKQWEKKNCLMGLQAEITKFLLVLLNLASCLALPPSPALSSLCFSHPANKADYKAWWDRLRAGKLQVKLISRAFFVKPNLEQIHSSRPWLQLPRTCCANAHCCATCRGSQCKIHAGETLLFPHLATHQPLQKWYSDSQN